MTTPDANVIEFDKYQPSTAQVLETLAQWITADDATVGICKCECNVCEEKIERVNGLYAQLNALNPAHLRQLAQAQADQQARLRGLVEGWRGRSERHHDAGIAGCADELEAVLVATH